MVKTLLESYEPPTYRFIVCISTRVCHFILKHIRSIKKDCPLFGQPNLYLLVRQEGLEPPTYRFEVCHSIQLSYWRRFISLA